MNDGEKLLEACPRCRSKIASPYARFCAACGMEFKPHGVQTAQSLSRARGIDLSESGGNDAKAFAGIAAVPKHHPHRVPERGVAKCMELEYVEHRHLEVSRQKQHADAPLSLEPRQSTKENYHA